MRGIKQLKDDMEESKRHEFKNLKEAYTYSWILRLLLEIIERMDYSHGNITQEELLEMGGIDGIAEKLRESLGDSNRPAGTNEGNN